MPMFSLKKKRLAYGKFSTQAPTAPEPRPLTGEEQTGGRGIAAQASISSVMDTGTTKLHQEDDGAIDEPLVLDVAAMHDGHLTNEQGPPLTPPPDPPIDHQDPFGHQDSWLSDDPQDQPAPSPPDFTRRGIHVPLRTSSSTPAANRKRISLQRQLSADITSTLAMSQTPEPQQSQTRSSSRTPSVKTNNSAPWTPTRARGQEPGTLRSSNESVITYESTAPSFATQALAPLQQKGPMEEVDRLSPLLEDDPRSFDLVAPVEPERRILSLEYRSEKLFSKEHLQAIFNDTASFLRFTNFLSTTRPKSVPILVYYLDALKALRAINYANAVAEALEPIEALEFTANPARPTVNAVLEEKANSAFDILVRDDLPAFITHIFIQVASVSISKRVTGQLSPLLREASEGLAEVFCLTDPSRTDNPIIFASEEFHRTTQYGVSYAIGRNCRFLQGPKTNKHTVARLGEMIRANKEHSEVFLNYRRDGSPFMNLLMMAPLLDSRGNVRYFIGAQIDVSGLVKDSTDLDAFKRMMDKENGNEVEEETKDEFQELCEMFNHSELDSVRRHGGSMHREQVEDTGDDLRDAPGKPRLLIQDQGINNTEKVEKPTLKAEGKLSGPYKHYLLIRPAPSLRILFTSPSLRVPGILQSHFLDRIGGTMHVRESLAHAFADGSRGVTAKIRWLSHAVKDPQDSEEEGRPRWIHCTPLLGPSGAVGVWMVVLVDEDRHAGAVRKFRQAPPIALDIRSRKEPNATMTPRSANPSRMGNYYDDDVDFGEYIARSPSANGYTTYSSNPPRHIAIQALRLPSSPRDPNFSNDQRAMRSPKSPSSSVRNYLSGREGSVDSFHI